MTGASKSQEWAAMWPLPLIAMLGTAGGGLYSYTNGVFMETLTAAFGWSRAQFSGGLMLQMVVGLVVMPMAGRLVDHFGPRKVALCGVVPFVLGVSLLSVANGSIWQWYGLCFLLGLSTASISPMVWVTAVASRFHTARGMALAVTLAGSGLGAAAWPVLAAIYVSELGWRAAFPALGLSWGLIVLPLAFVCFFGARDRPGFVPRQPAVSPRSYGSVLRSRTFIFLALSGGLYGAISIGLILHLVPILREGGLSLTAAASVAGFSGICAIVGRVGTGYLLDVLPTRPLSAVVFLMPIAAAAILWLTPSSLPLLIVAVAIIGLSAGAEVDIITYIAAREFPQQIFGSVYAAMQSMLALCASMGPVLASALYDARQSYDVFLAVITPVVIVSTVLILLIRPSNETPTTALAEDPAPG